MLCITARNPFTNAKGFLAIKNYFLERATGYPPFTRTGIYGYIGSLCQSSRHISRGLIPIKAVGAASNTVAATAATTAGGMVTGHIFPLAFIITHTARIGLKGASICITNVSIGRGMRI